MNNLRQLLALVPLTFALAIPAAHADTFLNYTPMNGSTVTVDITTAFNTYSPGNPAYVFFSSNGDSGQLSFFTSTSPQDKDFQIYYLRADNSYIFAIDDGPQLFTAPDTLNPGTYDLTPDMSDAISNPNAHGGTLVIYSAAPEPSSLVLLGTGALSLAGAVRRRLRRS